MDLYGEKINIGGIVAWNGTTDIEGNIESCYNLGSINTGTENGAGTTGVGGIIGYNYKGIIENCYSIGEINSNRNSFVGNIAGFSTETNIVNCYYLENYSFLGLGNEVADNKMKEIDFVDRLNGEKVCHQQAKLIVDLHRLKFKQ